MSLCSNERHFVAETLWEWGDCTQTLGRWRWLICRSVHIWENKIHYLYLYKMAPGLREHLKQQATKHHRAAVRGALECLKQIEGDDELIKHQAGFSAWAATAERATATIMRWQVAAAAQMVLFLFAFCPSGV